MMWADDQKQLVVLHEQRFHRSENSKSCGWELPRLLAANRDDVQSSFQRDLWTMPSLDILRRSSKSCACPFRRDVCSKDLLAVLCETDSFSYWVGTGLLLLQRYPLLLHHNCKQSLKSRRTTFQVRCMSHFQPSDGGIWVVKIFIQPCFRGILRS